MIIEKKIKSFILKTSLTLGLSLLITSNVYAANYTVVKGDTLYKLGKLFNTTASSLIKDNDLNTTTINIGQVLNVPCETYTVHKNDTLYLISKKYDISLDSLRKANNIYTNYIYIGQILNIPIKPDDTSITDNNISNTYSAEDLDLLSRLITAEAQIESYDTKIAVGAVVLNRVKSSSFPNTISEVIYQNIDGYYQFTPVLNGWINKPAGSDSIKAAKEVLNGVDPTNGALFFFESNIDNTWLLSREVSTIIDNMTFSY